MIFESIQKAFDVAIKAFGVANNIPVYLENIDTPTGSGDLYLASYLLLYDTEQGDLGLTEIRSGVYQVDIIGQPQTGTSEINKVADLINQEFYAGLSLMRNGICIQIQTVDLSIMSTFDGYVKKVLSINFETYTPRIKS